MSRGKSLVAFQIEPNAAEKVRQILDSVTMSFKDFDLVIQAFDPLVISSIQASSVARNLSKRPAQVKTRHRKDTIDRFHVAKAYRECGDKLRKTALRELKQGLEKEEYKLLKGTMWPFRRNAVGLEPEQRESVKLLLECAPDLRKAYDLREELSAIFDAKQSKESARRAITKWTDKVKRSGVKCFDSFMATLDNWLDEITNYFLDRQTSGLQEGFSNKIKVLKRRCYGITNISHLFQRIWLDLEGFKLFGI
jgi:transposase